VRESDVRDRKKPRMSLSAHPGYATVIASDKRSSQLHRHGRA
jgi:hypothetical protein